ncbi:MAG: nickel pincer cofactor biosynthesis protein LarC [Gemmatimonadota bacterium]|nr:MAG: nickel pincer cofactor biosynthesis protein LarC [Gemmatimonadota bacterium]
MEERSRCLIFDPFAGISGDMVLGALIDLGLEPKWLLDLVRSLSVQVDVRIEEVMRGSLKASAVQLEATSAELPRRLNDVLQIIEAADIGETARDRATKAFHKLAEVEGALHGVPADQVHFHEVGADDAIVDIVGSCTGIAHLGIERCFTRHVAVGRGCISTQHGSLPLPAPATLRLLEGLPVRESDLEGELTTPTGAVLLSVLTGGQRVPGEFVPIRSGYGAGNRDPATHPNCLRLIIAELEERGPTVLVQADVDDMSPEYAPSLVEALYVAGAIDVWTQPVQMKKSRTGLRIEVLIPESGRETISRVLFQHSTTIGLRYWRVQRELLPRSLAALQWRGFTIRVKTSTAPDGRVQRKLEYDDILAAARALGLSPLQVREEIERTLADPGASDLPVTL